MKLLLLTVVLIFGACSSSRLQIGGYTIERKGYVEKLDLDSFGRFQYSLFAGLLMRESFGSWQKIKHRIYITSDTSLAKRNGTAVESVLKNRNNSVKVIKLVEYLDNTPVQGLNFTVNDGVGVKSDTNGFVYFPGNINCINIYFLKQYQFFYMPRNPDSDYFEIRLAPINSSEMYFSKARIILKKGKLKFNNKVFKLKGDNNN